MKKRAGFKPIETELGRLHKEALFLQMEIANAKSDDGTIYDIAVSIAGGSVLVTCDRITFVLPPSKLIELAISQGLRTEQDWQPCENS